MEENKEKVSAYERRKKYFEQIFDNAKKNAGFPMLGEFETDFFKLQSKLQGLMDPFQIVIKQDCKFPFKIYDSDFLPRANELFKLAPKIKLIVDELVHKP